MLKSSLFDLGLWESLNKDKRNPDIYSLIMLPIVTKIYQLSSNKWVELTRGTFGSFMVCGEFEFRGFVKLQ